MVPNQPKSKALKPPTLARSRTYNFTPPPLHTKHPLQIHVQLIDKFLLHNLKMANIDRRNLHSILHYKFHGFIPSGYISNKIK